MTEPAATTETVLVVDRDDLTYIREAAEQHGVQVEELPTSGFEPVTAVTLMLLGGATAVALVTHLIEQRKGGQVIDLRPDAPKRFYRTNDLLYGYVAIHRVDGTITVEVKEPRGAFGQVLETLGGVLQSLGEGSLQTAEAAITSAVGQAAEVRVRDGAADQADSTAHR